jgi:hypothetical protein
MEYLIPNETERVTVMRWCATLIARPDIRMVWSLLLISEKQGVGKTTLAMSILRPLIGFLNTSNPSEAELEGSFNGWAARKRLAVASEIYSGHSRKMYDILKAVVSDPTVRINEKYIGGYDISNFVHVVACSNSLKALHLDDEDRRWFLPRLTEELKPKEWWADFYAWLKGDGLGIIKHWAQEFVKQHGHVPCGEHAPASKMKEEIIEGGRSDTQQIIHDIATAILADTTKPRILVVEELRHYIAERRGVSISDKYQPTAFTCMSTLRKAGLKDVFDNEGRKKRMDIRFKVNNYEWGAKSYVMAAHNVQPGITWKTIEETGMRVTIEKMRTIVSPDPNAGAGNREQS